MKLSNEELKKGVSKPSWNFINLVVLFILGIISRAILANYLAPDNFGVYSLILIILLSS